MSSEIPTYVPLELDITLDQIPDTFPCWVCDEEAPKALIEYGWRYKNEQGGISIATGQVPGYQCNSCGTQYYALETSIEALEKTYQIVLAAGDKETALDIQASLRAGLRHQAFFSRSPEQRT